MKKFIACDVFLVCAPLFFLLLSLPLLQALHCVHDENNLSTLLVRCVFLPFVLLADPLRGVVPLLRGDDLRQFSFAHFLLLRVVVVVLLLLAARAFTLVVALFELVSLSLRRWCRIFTEGEILYDERVKKQRKETDREQNV